MKEGDRIIWDSSFGYDIGVFVSDAISYGNVTIETYSGITAGSEISVRKSCVYDYSDELRDKMAQKYGHKYEFKNQLSKD